MDVVDDPLSGGDVGSTFVHAEEFSLFTPPTEILRFPISVLMLLVSLDKLLIIAKNEFRH